MCERGDRPNFEPRAQIYTGLGTCGRMISRAGSRIGYHRDRDKCYSPLVFPSVQSSRYQNRANLRPNITPPNSPHVYRQRSGHRGAACRGYPGWRMWVCLKEGQVKCEVLLTTLVFKCGTLT